MANDLSDEQLLPCPVCGFQPDAAHDDCLEPVDPRRTDLWEVHCYETGGGCENFAVGQGKAGAIAEWNRLATIAADRALNAPAQAEAQQTQEPDVADIIAGVLQTSRGHAYELMRDALNAAPAQAPAEPDMRHPKIQRLIGSNARKDIEMSLVEDLIEDPNCDQSSMAMEYWNSTHDKLREALLKQAAPVAPAGWRLVPVEPTYHMLRESLIPAAEAARYYSRMLAAAPQSASEPASAEGLPCAMQYAASRSMAVTKEWCSGWDDALAALSAKDQP